MSTSTLLLGGAILLLLTLGSWLSGRQSLRLHKRRRQLPDDAVNQEKRERLAWRADWWQDLSTELAGAIVTAMLLTIVFDTLQTRETEQQLADNQLQSLILQMGSIDNTTSIEAIRQLRAEGWLSDGSLQNQSFENADLTGAPLAASDLRGARFSRANLHDADLSNALLNNTQFDNCDLSGVTFDNADLSNANLSNSDLRDATFAGAKAIGANLNDVVVDESTLRGADLTNAKLQNVNLLRADLTGTILTGADLSGAVLLGVDLTGKDLTGVIFSIETILPDGNPWTPGTDMTQFTG